MNMRYREWMNKVFLLDRENLKTLCIMWEIKQIMCVKRIRYDTPLKKS